MFFLWYRIDRSSGSVTRTLYKADFSMSVFKLLQTLLFSPRLTESKKLFLAEEP